MSKLTRLTDSRYIEWSKKEAWSLTHAIYLLNGKVPPNEDETEEELIYSFQAYEEVIRGIDDLEERIKRRKTWTEYTDELLSKTKQDYDPDETEEQIRLQKRLDRRIKKHPSYPGSWIFEATNSGLSVNYCWQAIFHEYLGPDLDHVLWEKQEYSRFIRIFVTDESTPLDTLALYVMDLPSDQLTYTSDEARSVKEEFDELLLKMNTALELNERLDDLPSSMVSPRAFIQEYCRLHPRLDDRFTHWAEWLTNHKKLAKFLKDSGKKQTQTMNQSIEEATIAPPSRGGNPLLQELHRYINKHGLDSLDRDSFLGFIESNANFDHSHGTISFTQLGGGFKDVDMRALDQRIRRIRRK